VRDRGVERLTIQAVYRVAREEAQVRENMDALWKEPEQAEAIQGELRAETSDLYRFERMLETVEKTS